MKNKIILSSLLLLAFAACNNKNSSNEVAIPPAPPSNQCLMNQTTMNYNNPNMGYNNGYNGYYSGGYNSGYGYNYNNPGYVSAYGSGTCSPQLYNDYSQYGFAPYPYTNYNYNYGANYSYMPLCDCPANYRPVYNGIIGMGCVSLQYFNPIAVGAYYYSLTPNNYQWVNFTQTSNTVTTIGNQVNCFQQVAISCFTDQANNCGTGYICRSTAGGSRLGICTRQ